MTRQVTGILERREATKSGKSFAVQLGGQKYYTKHNSIMTTATGSMLQCEVNDSEYNGKPMAWIESFTLLGQPAASLPQPGAQPSTASAPPRHAPDNYQTWNGIPMPFISNVVGTAIESGKITKPEEIGAWVKHAIDALYEGEKLIRPYLP